MMLVVGALAVPATPAAAFPSAPYSGYVWAFAPVAASYPTTPGHYSFNGIGGTNTISRSGTGRYTVRFGGLNSAGGVAHTVAYGSGTRICTVGVWYRSGVDVVVPVNCFTEQGRPADTVFLANFTAHAGPGPAAVTYLEADWPARSAYVPTRFFDSSGGTPGIRRTGTGLYSVRLPASEVSPGVPMLHQVTAVGNTAVHCQLRHRLAGTGEHQVMCQDPTGYGVDSRFALTAVQRADLLAVPSGSHAYAHVQQLSGGRAVVRSGHHSAGGAISVTSDGPGSVRVVFPGLAGTSGHAVAHIHDNGHAICGVRRFFDSGPDKVVEAHCFEAGTAVPRAADVLIAFRR
jgi:hypothetical protein